MDAAMMETSLSIPLPPHGREHAPLTQCIMGTVVKRLTACTSMEDATDGTHGNGNASDPEEERYSDDDVGPSKLGTKE